MKRKNPDTRDGTIGFSSQLAGHGKAGKSHTTSFGSGLPETLPANKKAASRQENRREVTTSAVGRILTKTTEKK